MPESPIVYHGTFAEFKKFDKALLGSSTGAPSAFEGFFFATNKKVAEGYASDLNKRLRESGSKADLARKEIERITGDSYFTALHKAYLNSYAANIKNKIYELNEIISEYEGLETGIENIPMGYDYELDISGKLIKARLNLKNPLIYDMNGEEYRAISYRDIIKKAKTEGYDSLIIENTYDGANPVGNLFITDIYVAFDESQIKKINNNGNNATKTNQRSAKVYYTSTNPVFGKMSLKQFIETEVEERGNYTLTDVQNWMRKYGLSMDDLAIWVSPKKWVANRYNLLAEEWDKAENIPESEMEVNEIKGNEGFIIPESDDGDDGYLFVFKKSQVREASKNMIREGGTDSVNIVSKIIDEIKEKQWTVPEKRAEIVARLRSASSEIDRKIITEIRSFRPLGVIPEFGVAMGVTPRKGVRIDTLMGATVFDEKRMPSKERIDRWDAEHKEAERISEIVPEFAFSLEPRPNTVTGNYRVVEHGERLKAQGLLSLEEETVLEALEKYWKDHPELDRQKGYGVWGYNLDIMVPEGLRKNMTEKKGSLIDALLKIEPGKDIRIDYKDIPKGAERIIHLPTDRLSQPTNLTGSVLERKGDLIVVAISADNIITAHMFLQKGSQLIQIRPIPRKTTPIKGGEAITVYYTNWVERIKKEAPEYLPEWEISTQAGIRAGDTIIHKTAKYTAVVDKVYKNGNADITILEAKGIPEWEKSIKEGFPIKTTVKGADIDMYFEKAAMKNTEIKQPWEMTRGEAIAEAARPLGSMGISWGELRTALSSGRRYAESMHKDMVKLAIVEKKHVPAEVLNEYPDLIAKKKEPWEPTKETWEMTRAEFSKQEWFQRTYGGLTGANLEAAFSLHRVAIQNALELDKPVPSEVLKEYQDLKKKEVPVIHTYYFRNRPPDIGTYPQGAVTKEAWLPMRKTPKGNMALGWVKYERELTPDEIKSYELFVDEIVMPKLVAELVKFTHDEGIYEGFNVLKSKTGWSEYGLAFRDWLKANNEWKPDRGEEAEFLRHLARFTGKKPLETKLEDQEKAKLFLSALPRFTLAELIQQEATVRRWSIKFPQMEKELEDEYKMYLELRQAEKATAEEARKEKASKPQSDQAKELYKQMRKTNSVRELDDWRNKVLFEAHLPDVEEDILLRDLAAKWRTYLETRGIPALEALDKLPIDYTNEDYYFSTEVWIHPTTTIFDDQPLKGRLRQALNGGELFEVAIEGQDGTQRIQIDRIYVTKVIEKPEPRYKPKEETPDQLYAKLFSEYNPQSKGAQAQVSDKDMISFISTELKIPPEKASKLSWIFKQKLQDEYNAWKANEDAIRAGKLAEEQKQAKANELKFWDEVKDLKVVDFEVEHDINPDKPTRTYYHVYDRTFAILENGKKIQISYVIYKGEEGKRALKATKEFYARIYGQYMGKPLSEWITYDQLISNNRYESYKAQKPKTRFTFIPEAPQAPGVQAKYNAYISSTLLTTGALASPKFLNDEKMAQDIEKNIQVSRDEAHALVPQFRALAEKSINKEEVESVKELFGIDVEEEAHKLGIDLADYAIIKAGNKVVLQHKTIVQRRYELKPPAGFMKRREEEIQETLRKAEGRKALIVPPAVPPSAKPVQSIQEIKQQVMDSIQAAGTIEELQPVLKGIGFLPLPAPEKRQVMDAYQNKYSMLMSERPFGVPVRGEEKPKAIGTMTPQQSFEAELRRKAAESRKISAPPTLTSGAVTARRLEMFEPGAMEKAKAGIEARKRIEQLGLPYDVHPYVRKLAAGTQEVMKFGSKRGKETVEDLVLTRYVRYCPPGTIIDNRNVPKVTERWWVYPPKLRACMGEIEKKLAEAGAGMVKEGYSQRYRYSIYHDRRLFANEDDTTQANGIYNMLVRTYPKSAVELRENFVHPSIHQRTLKQYPILREIYVIREATTQLTPSMRSYIRGAEAVRDVIYYYRDNRPPTRGVLYRARDGTFFVEADGQVYSAMGWEDVSIAGRLPASRARA